MATAQTEFSWPVSLRTRWIQRRFASPPLDPLFASAARAATIEFSIELWLVSADSWEAAIVRRLVLAPLSGAALPPGFGGGGGGGGGAAPPGFGAGGGGGGGIALAFQTPIISLLSYY